MKMIRLPQLIFSSRDAYFGIMREVIGFESNWVGVVEYNPLCHSILPSSFDAFYTVRAPSNVVVVVVIIVVFVIDVVLVDVFIVVVVVVIA